MINYLDFIKKVQENKYIEWDLKTITSNDYTVEFQLDPAFYQAWLDEEFQNWTEKQLNENDREYVSRVEAFREWL